MSTGLTTWNQNLAEVSEIYPFVGTEMILAIAAIASWIIWHLIQIKMEMLMSNLIQMVHCKI